MDCQTPDEDWERDFYYTVEFQIWPAYIDWKSRRCLICEKDCGEADFDPADPSVGIRNAVWYNVCEEHGGFFTYEDGSQEKEEEDGS